MAADVKSIDALIDWKVHLVDFRQDGLDTLSGIQTEIHKADSYLDDQEAYWKRERRKAEEELVEAKAELLRREIPDFSGRTPDTTLQKREVLRCKQRIEECDDQIDTCRSWRNRLPRMVHEEYEGSARRLSNFLEVDLARGIAVLERQIDSLEKYAQLTNPNFSPSISTVTFSQNVATATPVAQPTPSAAVVAIAEVIPTAPESVPDTRAEPEQGGAKP